VTVNCLAGACTSRLGEGHTADATEGEAAAPEERRGHDPGDEAQGHLLGGARAWGTFRVASETGAFAGAKG
jgi:hypothetical protein